MTPDPIFAARIMNPDLPNQHVPIRAYVHNNFMDIGNEEMAILLLKSCVTLPFSSKLKEFDYAIAGIWNLQGAGAADIFAFDKYNQNNNRGSIQYIFSPETMLFDRCDQACENTYIFLGEEIKQRKKFGDDITKFMQSHPNLGAYEPTKTI